MESYNSNCEITNKKLIDEIVSELNCIQIKEKKNIAFGASEPKYFKLYLYSDINEKIITKSITIESDKIITIDDKIYEITNDVKLYEYFDDIMLYCGKILPQENEGNISSVECVGAENIDKAEIVEEYNNLLDVEPIKIDEVEQTDKYVVLKTLDDDVITIYYSDNNIFIEYDYGITGGNSSLDDSRRVVYYKK